MQLRKASEWRFRLAPGAALTVKLLAGTAEKDGIELAQRAAHRFTGPVQSKLLTWQGCDLEVDGRTDAESVARYASPTDNPAASHLNLHGRLSEMRAAAARERREGPRVLIAGPRASGKTTLARTLASYATRLGQQPIVVNADPGEGMLSLAGTMGAGVFATVMDPVAADGWGSTPTSGPSVVPVKLPLVYYYGRESAEEDADVYRQLFGRLAGGVSGRLSEDADVKSAGVIVDAMGVEAGSERGVDLLAHMVDELSGKNANNLEVKPKDECAWDANGDSEHCRCAGQHGPQWPDIEALCHRKDESGRDDTGHFAGEIRRRGGQRRGVYAALPRGRHQRVLFRRCAADAEPADSAGGF